jgi:ActR/RegA family two-component response regulator
VRTRTQSKERPLTLDELEQEHIREVLASTGNNKCQAAVLLGIDRKTLYRKLARMTRPENETGARAR